MIFQESVHLGMHSHQSSRFDDALDAAPVRHGHKADNPHKGHRRQQRRAHRPRSDARQFFIGEKVADEPHQRNDHPTDDGADPERNRNEEEFLREPIAQEQNDPDGDIDAERRRGDAVNDKPHPLTARMRRALYLPDAPHVAPDKVVEVAEGPLGQVGDLHQVRQDVIPVKPQERVAVENQRGDAGDEHDVIGNGVGRRALRGPRPHEGRHGRNGQFDEDTGSADHGTVPLPAEGPRTGGIHVRKRHEDQEHDTHDVDLAAGAFLAAELLARKRVAEFVEDLDQDKTDVQKREILRRQDPGGLVPQARDIVREKIQSRAQKHGPCDEAVPREDAAQDPHPPVQKVVGVQKRNPDEQEVLQVTLHFAADAFMVAAEKPLGVRRQVGTEKVRRVELAQQLDHLALGRCGITQLVIADAPGIGHRAPAVQQPHQPIGGRVQTKELVAGRILDHVPEPAAKVLAANLNGAPQARPQARDAIPRFAECRSLDRHGDSSRARTTVSSAPN